MDSIERNVNTEIDNLRKELEAYKSYHAEQTAIEITLILFGFVFGIWVGYIIGSP